MTWDECMEALGASASFVSEKRDFTPLRQLLKRLGNPENSLSCIHIAGSNGKGSIAVSLQHILSMAKYRTGLYISPHLESMNERFTNDGVEISDAKLREYAGRIKKELSFLEKKPNIFDLLTALAFLYFYEEKVDLLVLEVGLGGRMDATNIIPDKILAIIAHIGLEHTAILGNSLKEIAREKAGIIAYNRPVVVMQQSKEVLDEIKAVAKEKNAGLILSDSRYLHSFPFSIDNGYQYFSYKNREEYALSLLGDFQLDNAMVICEAIDCLKDRGYSISEEAVKLGLYTVEWKGRFEILKKNPLIILDGAHNPQAVQSLVRSVEMFFPNHKKRILFSVMEDKNYSEMLYILKNNAESFCFAKADDSRGLNPEFLKSQWQEEFAGEIYLPSSLEEGLKWNLDKLYNDKQKSLLLCLGSLYQVARIRAYCRDKL